MEKSSVTFLSPTNFDKMYNSSKYHSKFDQVFLSVSNSKKIDKNLLPCLKPNGLVVAETAKYVLDLKKEQQETHLNAGKSTNYFPLWVQHFPILTHVTYMI